jgi:hypothetical protein
MSQQTSGKADVKSFLAGDTMGSGVVVTFMTAGADGIFVRPWLTDTAVILGVTMQAASATGEALDVMLAAPTVKCRVGSADIAAGAIVGPETGNAGAIITRANPGTVTTFMVPTLGIALEAGSLTSIIEVLLQPVSTRPSDG